MRSGQVQPKISLRFALFATFCILTFLMGGGARADIQSLAVLRPLAVAACVFALFSLSRDDWRAYKFPIALLLSVVALVFVHLIPLPPALWSFLPQADLYNQVSQAAQIGTVYRPISMVPPATQNAFWSLFVPLATLFLLIGLRPDDRSKILPLLIFLGLLSAVIGLLQIIGPPNGPFYFYRITNNGTAVGLFSNRNHHAVFLGCLFPLLAAWAATYGGSEKSQMALKWTSVGIGLFLIPLILVTGSRAGLVIGLLGVLSIPFVTGISRISVDLKAQAKKGRKFAGLSPSAILIGIAAIAATAMVAATLFFSKAQSIDRLHTASDESGFRLAIWDVVLTIFPKFLPLGTGAGSFVEIYQMYETDSTLGVSYVNHAHNDILEIALTLGIPGLLLMLVAIMAWGRGFARAVQQRKKASQEAIYGRAGFVVTALLALASVVDYPLRVPSISILGVIASVWAYQSVSEKFKSGAALKVGLPS